MSRRLCVVVRTVAGATQDDLAGVERALRTHVPPLNAQRDGGDFYVFYGRGHGKARALKVIAAALHAGGVEDLVAKPFPVAHWSKTRRGYVLVGTRTVLELPPEEFTWIVEVRPASAFVWRSVRKELSERGRRTLGETDTTLTVGARDELDARTLSEELCAVTTIAAAKPRKLGWYRRWLIRQAVAGNYASDSPDPTQPPSFF